MTLSMLAHRVVVKAAQANHCWAPSEMPSLEEALNDCQLHLSPSFSVFLSQLGTQMAKRALLSTDTTSPKLETDLYR